MILAHQDNKDRHLYIPQGENNFGKYAELIIKTVFQFKLKRNRLGNISKNSINDIPNLNACVLKTSNSNPKQIFRDRLHTHNYIYLLTKIANEQASLFIPVLQGVQIVFCVWANFGLLKFNKVLDIILILFLFASTVAFEILDLILLRYGALPVVISQEFIWFWKGERIGKVERKQLRSVKNVGYFMGTFFLIKNRSAMDVLDTIFSYTVTATTTFRV